MKGYRNLPDKTKETFTDDGWLTTGDIGEFDEDGYLKIVDRKKELIINAAGKNMSPANIEAKLKTAGPLIGQAVAIGDQRPFNTALVTLDPDSAPGWAKENGHRGQVDRGARRRREGGRGRPGGDRAGERVARSRGADQEVQDPARPTGSPAGTS